VTRYAVFLRGVNVGGITIKSADLRETFESLPVSEVKTLLASGNVVCSSDLTAADLKSKSEHALRERFGYEAWVVVLDADMVERIVADCPFPADDPATHTYVSLFSDPALMTEMVAFGRSIGEPVRPLGTIAAAWQSPKGSTLESPLNAFTNRARFRSATTTRNLRTLQKVLAALQG
jgi:uncharacterized protein (DUF1697 family)